VRAAFIAAFVCVTVLGCRGEPPAPAPAPSASSTPPPSPDVPAAADARALLDGLAPGADLGGAKVIGIWAPRADATLRVEVEARAGVTFRIGIVRRREDPKERRPPAVTQGYEIGFGEVKPEGSAFSAEAAASAVKAVEERIRRTESRVPVPAGL
jgi:hypothetical protein